MKNSKILVTGSAGFIGYHLVKKLIDRGDDVVGLDNINDYYDTNLKFNRLCDSGIEKSNIKWNILVQSDKYEKYRFVRMNLEDTDLIFSLFKNEKFDVVVNLAGQAGVRFSLQNPLSYIKSNIVGFGNILEACRTCHIKHLVYASSSSVYGANTKMPFSVKDGVDHPLSIYAASKRANELMAHTYSHLFQLPTTGLRFFTVYGPWGRPDMALLKFTKLIDDGMPIQIFNGGKHKRDFTYIDDIIMGIELVIDEPAQIDNCWNSDNPNPSTSNSPWRIYNIGNSNPQELSKYISLIEKLLGKSAIKEMLAIQLGDLPNTYADISDFQNQFNFHPNTSIEEGIQKFISWYISYSRNHNIVLMTEKGY